LTVEAIIYCILVSGAIVAAGFLAAGVSMNASMALGYGVVLALVAGAFYRRHKRRSRGLAGADSAPQAAPQREEAEPPGPASS
jgi:hypothetical protein